MGASDSTPTGLTEKKLYLGRTFDFMKSDDIHEPILLTTWEMLMSCSPSPYEAMNIIQIEEKKKMKNQNSIKLVSYLP